MAREALNRRGKKMSILIKITCCLIYKTAIVGDFDVKFNTQSENDLNGFLNCNYQARYLKKKNLSKIVLD